MPCSRAAKKLFESAGVLAACVVLGLPAMAWATELKDATGAQVHVVDAPRRIVTLAPSLGELAADLSGQHLERIVGVSEYTDYPPALSKARSVGPYDRFNLEAVAALKPDLVLATLDGNPKDQVLHLREMKIPVVVVASSTIAQVSESMRLVGRAMGVAGEGERMAQQFEKGMARVRMRAAGRSGNKPKVLLQVGDEPLVTVGGSTFLNEALEVVGARNAYADSTAHDPRPSVEDVLKRAPDVLLVIALGKDREPYEKMAKRWQEMGRGWRVKVLQADALLRPTLRLLEGLSLLEGAVHGTK